MKKILTIIIALLPLFATARTHNANTGGKLSFSLPKKYSPVVAKAVEMANAQLSTDKSKTSSLKSQISNRIEVFQLDKASNKEMKSLGSWRVPVMKFITRKDAFWIGVRGGRLVVVGSNGRGAAYGVLQAADVLPTVDDSYETLQIPSVEYRGIALENFGDVDYAQLFRLMLRLRANTLCEGLDEGEAPQHFVHQLRAIAEDYGVVLATPHGGNSLRLLEHKSNKSVDITWHDDNYGYMESSRDGDDEGAAVYHLSFQGQPHDYLWLCTTQPGLVVNEMKTAFANGGNKLWLAAVHNPAVAAYQLRLFMDLAWDVNSVKVDSVRQHLRDWLATEYGAPVADRIAEPMAQYFRLVGIRRPEFMDFSRQSAATSSITPPGSAAPRGDGGVRNTEFNAEEFGNELERYINDYAAVCKKVEGVERLVSEDRRDDYFRQVKYPVFCSALMAVKTLQAQESRLIGRPASFHIDSEALESAVRSIKAYRKIQELTERYNSTVARSDWNVAMDAAPRGLAVFGKPVLTDSLSETEISRYGNSEPVDAPLNDDNTIVRNACQYTEASGGARCVDLLGRSLRAVDMYGGNELRYTFRSGVVGGVLRLAFVPTHAIDGGSLQCSVQIDGNAARTIIVTDGSHGDRWADGVLRGQAVVTLPVSLTAGQHTLTVKALSDHVVLDQWMIDRDTDRQFYVMPVK